MTHRGPHVHHPPHGPHRMGRLRSRRHRLLSALFRHVQPLDRAPDRAGARREEASAQRAATVSAAIRRWRREARFLLPTRYGDDVEIESAFTKIGRSSFAIQHQLTLDGALAVEGNETRVWVVRDAEPARRPARAADAGRCRRAVQRYCGLTPSCFAIARELGAAARPSTAANSAPVPGLTTCPVAVSRDATVGSATASLTSAAMRSRTACRHVARAEQADEAVEGQLGKARLRHRRRIRLGRRALAVGDRDQLDPAGLDVRLHDRERADIGLDAAFAEIGDRPAPRRDRARA